MDTYQFYNSASRLALAIDSSGLMQAVKKCRSQLAGASSDAALGNSAGHTATNDTANKGPNTNRKLAEAMLLRAGGDYMEHARRYSAADKLVVEQFHLQQLESADYWDSLTDEGSPSAGRLGELVSLYSRLMFASSHLPRLLSLMQESLSDMSGHVVAGDGKFALELSDLSTGNGSDARVETAADPDRVARVIDAANMIYQGVALLAGGSPHSLQLGSITGSERRTLVFTGQQESATAVRRIIRHLDTITRSSGTGSGNIVSSNAESADVGVESLVEQLPFLSSLDELERIGALSSELISDIRSNVTAGSIMLIEAGAGLSERQASESVDPPDDASLSGSNNVVEAEVEAHYLDQYQAMREQMVGQTGEPVETDTTESLPAASEIPANTSKSASNATVPTQKPAASAVDQEDDLDDLILDLNRLYKR